MERGYIIYLNGTSSAGKTSIAGELEAHFPDSYLISLDAFLNMPTSHLWKEGAADCYPTVWHAMHNTIDFFMAQGKTIIVDTVSLHSERHGEFLSSMRQVRAYRGLLVYVSCPLAELQRRELARGDRDIGLAESQLPFLPPAQAYDVVVDSCTQAPEACAAAIAAGFRGQEDNRPFEKAIKLLGG